MTGLQEMKNVGELVEVMTMGSDKQTVFEGNSKGFIDYITPTSFDLVKGLGTLIEGVKKVQSFHSNKSVLFLNINSFMAGATDIWKKAKENELIKAKIPPTDPSHSDGKIEVVSFIDSSTMGLEKTLGKKLEIGFAERIIQGEGPFFIKFREYTGEAEHKTFIQIDG